MLGTHRYYSVPSPDQLSHLHKNYESEDEVRGDKEVNVLLKHFYRNVKVYSNVLTVVLNCQDICDIIDLLLEVAIEPDQ